MFAVHLIACRGKARSSECRILEQQPEARDAHWGLGFVLGIGLRVLPATGGLGVLELHGLGPGLGSKGSSFLSSGGVLPVRMHVQLPHGKQL